MAKTTLVNEKKNPSEVTTSNPTIITQLKSEGYRVKEDDEQTSGGSDGAADGGATGGSTATAVTGKGKSGGSR